MIEKKNDANGTLTRQKDDTKAIYKNRLVA